MSRLQRPVCRGLSRLGSPQICAKIRFDASCSHFSASAANPPRRKTQTPSTNHGGANASANANANANAKATRRFYTKRSAADAVRIGCASGFWGDTATSVPQLVHGGRLDFLVFDYLSEITMSLLTAAKAKAPDLGYAPDFVHFALAPFINDIHRKGIRVVSNAGGVNPLACADAIRAVVKKAGLEMKVAVVTGDDLMPHRKSLAEVKMADGGASALPAALHSMNAYLG